MTSESKVMQVTNKAKFIGNHILYQYLPAHNLNFVKEAGGRR
jgi:hypothetical protein